MQRDEDSLQSIKDLFDPGVMYISQHKFHMRCLRDYPGIVLYFLTEKEEENIRFVTQLPDELEENVMYVDISNPAAICIHAFYNNADFINYPKNDMKKTKYVLRTEYLGVAQSDYLLKIKDAINQQNKLKEIEDIKNGKMCVAAIETDIDKRDISDQEKRAMKVVMMICVMAYHFRKLSELELKYSVRFNCKIDRDWPDALSLYLDKHKESGKSATDLIYAFIETIFKNDKNDFTLFYFNSRFLRFTSEEQAVSAIDKLKENKDNNDFLFAIPRSMLSQPASICVTHMLCNNRPIEIQNSKFEDAEDMRIALERGGNMLSDHIVPTVLITPQELYQVSHGQTIKKLKRNIGGYVSVKTAYTHTMPGRIFEAPPSVVSADSARKEGRKGEQNEQENNEDESARKDYRHNAY